MVYPLNLLNEMHLEIRVNDISLREWIKCGASRRSLNGISNSMRILRRIQMEAGPRLGDFDVVRKVSQLWWNEF